MRETTKGLQKSKLAIQNAQSIVSKNRPFGKGREMGYLGQDFAMEISTLKEGDGLLPTNAAIAIHISSLKVGIEEIRGSDATPAAKEK